jgi:plasmid stabilization system protein ParE
MSFAVRILRQAASDAHSIFNWLAARSPHGAARWYAALLSATTSLSTDPLRHGIAPESSAVGHEIRQRFFKTRHGRIYRLLFVVVADEVRILRIRGPGQPPVTAQELGP